MEKTDELLEETGEAVEETGEAVYEIGETVEETGEAVEETGETVEETGEAVYEIGETVEEYMSTVSSGDSENVEAGIGSGIVEVILSAEQNELFERNNELLENLTAVIEKENTPIMEKYLIDYTVSEGLLLILTVFALGVFVGRIIGRILPCRI